MPETENWVFLSVFLLKRGKTGVSFGKSVFFSCLDLVYVNVRKFCRPGKGFAGRGVQRKGNKREFIVVP